MDLKQYFMYESTYIPEEKVFLLTEEFLDDLYVTSDEIDKFNIFFHLQNEYFYLLRKERHIEAAYVCYLISYYLFQPLTPPHSCTLAYEYAARAIELNPIPKYSEWLEEVGRGN